MRFGFKHHTEAIFLLLRVKDPAAARRWLAGAPVTSAVTQEPPPPTALQLAFTYAGLRALECPRTSRAAFSMEFVDGMSGNPNRARRLGDVGPNDPTRWEWGAGGRDTARRRACCTPCRAASRRGRTRYEAQIEPGFELVSADRPRTWPASSLSDSSTAFRSRRSTGAASGPCSMTEQLRYTNLSCLGEYLLGYPNEYALYTRGRCWTRSAMH